MNLPFDSITDLLIAHGFNLVQDDGWNYFHKSGLFPDNVFRDVHIDAKELSGYTVESFYEMACAKGWLKEVSGENGQILKGNDAGIPEYVTPPEKPLVFSRGTRETFTLKSEGLWYNPPPSSPLNITSKAWTADTSTCLAPVETVKIPRITIAQRDALAAHMPIEILRITADGDIILRGVKIGHDDELGAVQARRLYGQT